MAIVITDDTHYKNIANTMRELACVGNLKPSEMPNAIIDIYNAGQQDGAEVGLEDGIERGKQAEWNSFWDAFQRNGTNKEYAYAFRHRAWSDTNFKPKYDIVPDSISQCFASTGIKDLVGCLKATGVSLDTSECGGFSYTFFSSLLENIPTIDTTGAPKLEYSFYQADKLHTLEKLILKEDGSQTFTSTFGGCSALENIVIEGCIGNNISFSGSPKLSYSSLMSILQALKDFSGTDQTRKLTLGSANLAKLTAEEKAIAENKGWSLA